MGVSSISQFNKSDRIRLVACMGRLALFLFSFLSLTFIFISLLFFPPQNPFKSMIDHEIPSIQPLKHDDSDCDLFKGNWVPDQRGSLYTNSSCLTIPSSKNCFMQGRPDVDFVNWRWKPYDCNLPRLNPKLFMKMVHGKKMTFVGDSVARNHVESLLCLLSTEESPEDVYKDSEDRNRIWQFTTNKFTLATSWSKFLVAGHERRDSNNTGTGIYDLYLDVIDDGWVKDLTTADIVVISDAHWFFRPIVLHRGNRILACIYCNLPNITQISHKKAFKMVFAAVFKHIDGCRHCKRSLVTILRTFSPAHFENGTWNTGGGCRRTSPLTENDINLQSNEMELRNAQVEQLERVKNHRHSNEKRFGVLDITRAMVMRPDGHPNAYWGNKWMKGYNDCVHWCMPGPIDVWNDLLMAILKRLI